MLPEGLRTIKWSTDGTEIVDTDFVLQTLVRKRLEGRHYPLHGTLGPLDPEEWLEEHYNVMA